MSKLFLNRLKNLDLDGLDDEDEETLISFCRSTLEFFEVELEGKKQEQEETAAESKESKEDGQATTPASDSAFIFNLGASEKWPASKGTSIREKAIARRKEQRPMPKDVWSEDRVQREIALQERSDAVANDSTPSIDPFAPLDDGSQLVLVRRVSDGWLETWLADEAADLIASGEYRPFMATEGYSDNGALSCQADPEWVDFGRKERVTALLMQQARADMDAMAASISFMSDEEIDELESSLIRADPLEVQP